MASEVQDVPKLPSPTTKDSKNQVEKKCPSESNALQSELPVKSIATISENEPVAKPFFKIDFVDIAQSILLHPRIYFCIAGIFCWFVGYTGASSFWAMVAIGLLVCLEVMRFQVLLNKEIKEHCDEFRQPNEPEHESVEFLNYIVAKAFKSYPGYVEEKVRTIANAQLEEKKPKFLDALTFDRFVLGETYPKFSNIRVWHDNAQELKMDVQVDWPSDMIATVTATKKYPLSISVKDIYVHARLRIFVRLLPNKEPYACYAWVQSLDRPRIDFRFNIPLTWLLAPVEHLISEVACVLLGHPKRLEVDLGRLLGAEITDKDLLPPPLPTEVNKGFLRNLDKMFGGIVGGLAGAGGAVVTGGASVVVGAGKLGVGAVTSVGRAGTTAAGGVARLGMATFGGATRLVSGSKESKGDDAHVASAQTEKHAAPMVTVEEVSNDDASGPTNDQPKVVTEARVSQPSSSMNPGQSENDDASLAADDTKEGKGRNRSFSSKLGGLFKK